MSLRRARAAVDGVLEAALATLLLLMVAVVLWQVATRVVLGSPASGTEELVRFALLWLSLLGASYGFGKGAHLAIDLLPAALTGRGLLAQRLFVPSAVAFFALSTLVVGGGRLAQLTLALGQSSASLAVERGYVYLVLPLSGVLISFYAVSDAIAALRESRESEAS